MMGILMARSYGEVVDEEIAEELWHYAGRVADKWVVDDARETLQTNIYNGLRKAYSIRFSIWLSRHWESYKEHYIKSIRNWRIQ